MMLLEGSCHCGAIRFRVRSAHPCPFNLCYCNICRKTGGGGGLCDQSRGRVRIPRGGGGGAPERLPRRDAQRRARVHQPGRAQLLRLLRDLAVAVGSALAGPRSPAGFHDRYGTADSSGTHPSHAGRQAVLGEGGRTARRPALRRLSGGVPRRVARAPGTHEPRLSGGDMLLSRIERMEARARRAFALKKFPATVTILEQLLEEVGENPHTLGMLALCCHRAGRHEKALAYAERALEVDAGNLVALRTMSSILAAEGRHDEACAFAKRGLEVLAREALPPESGGWRDWLAVMRGLRPSKEEQEWAEWARGLVLRSGVQGAGERTPGRRRSPMAHGERRSGGKAGSGTRTGLRRLGWAMRYSLRGIAAALRLEPAFRQECVLALILDSLGAVASRGTVGKGVADGKRAVGARRGASQLGPGSRRGPLLERLPRARGPGQGSRERGGVSLPRKLRRGVGSGAVGAPRAGSAVGCAVRSRGSTVAEVRPPPRRRGRPLATTRAACAT